MKILAWLIGTPVAVLLALLMTGALVKACQSPESAAAARKEDARKCSAALTSNIGRSTTGYADRQAYEKRVAEACSGFDIKR
jgi:hypothetical protein